MKITMKFKGGLEVNTDIHASAGDYNFFNVLLEGVKNNSAIRMEGKNGEKINLTYADLETIEIKVHE